MYIYWEDHLRKVLDNEQWHLYSDFDNDGNACLFLNIGNEQYCVCNGEDWTQNEPELSPCYMGIPFSAVVREVSELMTKEELRVLDLASIVERQIDHIWEEWKVKGYVE